MPSRAEIEDKLRTSPGPHDVLRRGYLKSLHRLTKRDTILYCSPYSTAKGMLVPGSLQSIGVMDIQGFMAALKGLKGQELDLIIHSAGGSLEAADQIVQYLRNKYDHIRVFVPQSAMSAATMIACAADEIWLGNQSSLGPIDPQITLPTGNGGATTVAAQSILDEFRAIQQQVRADPRLAALWAPKVLNYPPGLLDSCQSAVNGSKTKVREWLEKYMLKSLPDCVEKAAAVADWLGEAKEHSSHGRPIGWEIAKSKGLKIERLETHDRLKDLVLSVFHASLLTIESTECFKLIENHNGRGLYFRAGIAQQQIMPKLTLPSQPVRPPAPSSPAKDTTTSPIPTNK